MKIKAIIEEDFVNYKKSAMFIIFPYCTFKCDKECGEPVCQNSKLAHQPTIEIGIEKIFNKYINNPISSSIVCGGLEPFDSATDLLVLISVFRNNRVEDDIVIYTGYTEEELISNPFFNEIISYKNIVIKFGRYLPNQRSHYDIELGVNLASPNQYGKRYN